MAGGTAMSHMYTIEDVRSTTILDYSCITFSPIMLFYLH